MIQILPCPACQRSTVLMEGVSLEATIQCPHCEEQFVVGELLTSTFGSWNVVNDPALPHGSPELVAATADDDDEELRVAPLDKPTWTGTGPNRRLVRRRRGKVNPETDWSKFEPITYEQFEKLRRQSGGSPGRLMLQVGLGGLAAVPIALLLIWHVLGTDVLGAGPMVGQYAPWIVPARFRPAAEAEAEDNQLLAENLAAAPPKAGESGFRNFDDELGISSSTGPGDELNASQRPAAPSLAPPNASGRPTVLAVDGGEPAETPPVPSFEDMNTASGSEAALDSPVTPPAPLNTPTDVDSAGTQGNIFDSIRQTTARLEQRKEGESVGENQQGVSGEYRALLQLATGLEGIPKENQVWRTVRAELQPIGQEVTDSEALQQELDASAKAWLTSQSQASSPLPLAWIAEIEEAVEVNDHWQITPTATTQPLLGDQAVSIVVPRTLAPNLLPGERLLLLGSIRNPAQSTAAAGTPSPPRIGGSNRMTTERPTRPTLGAGVAETPGENVEDSDGTGGEAPAESAAQQPATAAPSPWRFEAGYLHSL